MQRIPPITGDVASVFSEKNDNSRIYEVQRYIFIEIIPEWVIIPHFSEHSILKEIRLSFELYPVEGKNMVINITGTKHFHRIIVLIQGLSFNVHFA